jgi:hypothetical protein
MKMFETFYFNDLYLLAIFYAWYLCHISGESPKRRVLKDKQDEVLDKDKTVDNVQKRNNFINIWREEPDSSVVKATGYGQNGQGTEIKF